MIYLNTRRIRPGKPARLLVAVKHIFDDVQPRKGGTGRIVQEDVESRTGGVLLSRWRFYPDAWKVGWFYVTETEFEFI